MRKTPLAASGTLLESAARKMRGLDWEWLAIFYARIALGAAFLSGIASRFGLYGKNVGYGNFASFEHYTAEVNSFMPAFTIPFLAWSATAAELVLGIALILGVWPRWVALGSAALLVLFGITMAISFGIKSPPRLFGVFRFGRSRVACTAREPQTWSGAVNSVIQIFC